MADRFIQVSKPGYWRFCRWLVLICLMAWLLATLVPLALAQIGVTGTVLGWPLVFAMAAFGVPLVYLGIIAVYSLVMDRVERDNEIGGEGS
ncbi:MAG: DUF4212 domain-containing protein [Burkholderiaceae bacterium]|nr:DUF4212 domain-containing protein [Burkholderiaceae bacterium]MCD8516192.1 DUF4212 domain-containing protein [Burkholderiaceae bacterium]MCD8538200.1 DUF4212 domain-containing protein [Burkholderiaceae bacterium]MCD8566199.1 DUF4212 domain-containing protein [Burkholderiaceae bacterium]